MTATVYVEDLLKMKFETKLFININNQNCVHVFHKYQNMTLEKFLKIGKMMEQ